jgi:hypothetical protein
MHPAATGVLCLQAESLLKTATSLFGFARPKIRTRVIVLIGQGFSGCEYSPTRTKLNGSEIASDIPAFARECRW